MTDKAAIGSDDLGIERKTPIYDEGMQQQRMNEENVQRTLADPTSAKSSKVSRDVGAQAGL